MDKHEFKAKSFKRIPIEEMPGTYLRRMSFKTVREYCSRIKDAEPETSMLLLLAGTLVNEENERLFSFDELDELQEIDSFIFGRLCDKAKELSDITAEDIETLKKR